jgi:hypothetical protein
MTTAAVDGSPVPGFGVPSLVFLATAELTPPAASTVAELPYAGEIHESATPA